MRISAMAIAIYSRVSVVWERQGMVIVDGMGTARHVCGGIVGVLAHMVSSLHVQLSRAAEYWRPALGTWSCCVDLI